jgi:hypothetical protein
MDREIKKRGEGTERHRRKTEGNKDSEVRRNERVKEGKDRGTEKSGKRTERQRSGAKEPGD